MKKIISKKKNEIIKNNFENSNNKTIYNKTTLPNGIRIISEEIPTVESYSLGIFIDAGSRNDPKGKEGLSHFLEHALFRHTKTRSSRVIASEFESVGAYTNAYTTKEQLCFYVRALTPHFKKTFNLLSDLVLNPLFIPKEIEKEKQVILEEIKSYEDDPEEMIFDEVDKILFKNHTLGIPIAGYIDSVSNINCDDLNEYHRNFFTPANILIVCSGNIPHQTIDTYAKQLFSSINSVNNYSKEAPQPHFPTKIELTKPFTQSHLVIIRSLPGYSSDEKYAISMLNIMLGDGMSSRLNHQIRERHGLAYNIESSVQLNSDCGGFCIYAAMDDNNALKAENLIKKELLKFIETEIPQAEINRAKEQLKSSTVMAMESMSNRMQALAKDELILHFYEDIPATIQKIDAITNDEIKSIAEKYFNLSDWSVVVFHPESE